MRISDWSSDVCSSDLHVPATGGVCDVRGRIGVEECTEVGGARPLPPGRRAGHLDMLTQIVAEHGPDGQSSRLLTLVAGVLVFALDEPRGETTARLARICRAKRKSSGPGSPSVVPAVVVLVAAFVERSEEHTSELQS